MRDLPTAPLEIHLAVDKNVEGHAQISNALVELEHLLVAHRGAAEHAVLAQVDHQGAVAADGVAHGRVIGQFGQDAVCVATCARHELHAAFRCEVEHMRVALGHQLLRVHERAIEVGKDELEHVLLPHS